MLASMVTIGLEDQQVILRHNISQVTKVTFHILRVRIYLLRVMLEWLAVQLTKNSQKVAVFHPKNDLPLQITLNILNKTLED